jgi:hypothetical protein
VKAFDFRDLWNKLDTSGDRMVTLNELTNIIPKEGHPPPPPLPSSLSSGGAHLPLVITEAEALLQAADNNDDGELTFAELASTVSVHPHPLLLLVTPSPLPADHSPLRYQFLSTVFKVIAKQQKHGPLLFSCDATSPTFFCLLPWNGVGGVGDVWSDSPVDSLDSCFFLLSKPSSVSTLLRITHTAQDYSAVSCSLLLHLLLCPH